MVMELVIDGTPTGRRGDFITQPDFTGHPTKSTWVWLPVVFVTATPGANQALADPVVTVENGNVVVTRSARAKTSDEVTAEHSARLRAHLDYLTVMFVRLAEQLLADNTIQAGDFSARLRQVFQQAQGIADALDP